MRSATTISLLLLLSVVLTGGAIAQDAPDRTVPASAGTAREQQDRVTRPAAPEVGTRWMPLGDDSMRVEYALPGIAGRPAVLVLSDRFGLQENVRSTLKVLAALGFRAYALPLRSAPESPLTSLPDAAIDSADIPRITRAAVDIANEEGCDGRLFLLAYDVGADIAIEVIARFPFYKGAALFYPAAGPLALRRLLDAQCPFQLHVAQFDPACSITEVNELREIFLEQRKRLHVFYYKEARRFFCNPEHPDYHKDNTQNAWNQINKFFRYP